MGGYETTHLIIDINNNEIQPWNIKGSRSIHRVPHSFRKSDENAYVPQIISIGPFHRDDANLKAMEKLKRKYLLDVISWSLNNSKDSSQREMLWGKYLKAVESVEAKARHCYSEPIDLDSKNFVEMMVIDGCFIIGILCKVGQLIHTDNDDPIFGMVWLWMKLQNDLLVLENQIPFFVLRCLFNLMKDPCDDDCPSLESLAFYFLKRHALNDETATKEDPNIRPRHLLHLFHSSLLPMPKHDNQSERNRNQVNSISRIRSVTALMEAGIKFKKAKSADSFFDVKFNKGTLEIPTFVIDGATLSLFHNLIAFEQYYTNCTKHFTAYTTFMSYLINSDKDVRILRKRGIIQDLLGNSDGDVARLFKMLCRDVAISKHGFYLSDTFLEVNLYPSTKWDVGKENLKRYYYNSRWAVFPAGFILLVLTIIQTIFTALSYFHHP